MKHILLHFFLNLNDVMFLTHFFKIVIFSLYLGSDSSQQSWFMPSSEASALSAEEIEGVDSGFSGKFLIDFFCGRQPKKRIKPSIKKYFLLITLLKI